MMKNTVSLIFAVMLSFVGISTTAWGGDLNDTEWLVDMSSQVSAGKAGKIKSIEPYLIEFSGTNFTIHSVAEPDLGFTGGYDEAANGKTVFTPNPTELTAYIQSRIHAAAALKGNNLSINDVTIKKVSSPSKVAQDFADLHLTYGLSVSFSFTGTLNGKDLKASGSLVMKAKGLLADEGTSDNLPDTTWNFTGKESISLARVGSASGPIDIMRIAFGSGNTFTMTTFYRPITGTYTIDDKKKNITFHVTSNELSEYLIDVIEDAAGGYLSGTMVTNVTSKLVATLSGDTMKFTGSGTFDVSSYMDGVYGATTGKYKITAGGVNMTGITKESKKLKLE